MSRHWNGYGNRLFPGISARPPPQYQEQPATQYDLFLPCHSELATLETLATKSSKWPVKMRIRQVQRKALSNPHPNPVNNKFTTNEPSIPTTARNSYDEESRPRYWGGDISVRYGTSAIPERAVPTPTTKRPIYTSSTELAPDMIKAPEM
eukprot:CAMPEP_0185044360 /NCGR_PEP_ID=MMETSP1103-20130426/43404_1 /TAXON_ID=36769 /ORGANISM="Paraphysomonas bandaiensis, Strain Caron Lab Isolate" /LENGTH=149 /DNA_ID=CAMNT_0027584613 /DNA_START=802 /DNA_END=1250 /DNA_ORIENTATION=+